MHAIILAAGMGRRLGTPLPKPLTPIAPPGAGLTLLGNQIAILSGLLDPDRIMVVVGHEAMRVISAQPDMMFAYNARHAQTNTARSLLLALRKVDDDVLWVNGDLYFEREAAARLLAGPAGASRALVDPAASVGDEQVKYTLHADGSIARLSKDATPSGGESLGMHILMRSDRQALLRALEDVGDQDYFERAMEACTLAGVIRVLPVDAGGAYCREVDFPEDLEAVRQRVAAVGAAADRPGAPPP